LDFYKSFLGLFIGSLVLNLRDRHTDNILISEGGLIFHIDFTFSLGRQTVVENTLGTVFHVPAVPMSYELLEAMHFGEEELADTRERLRQDLVSCFAILQGSDDFKTQAIDLGVSPSVFDLTPEQISESLALAFNSTFEQARGFIHYLVTLNK
jgi:hypothetical protein